MENKVFKSEQSGFWYYWQHDEGVSMPCLTKEDALADYEQYCIWLETGKLLENAAHFNYVSDSQYQQLTDEQITSMHNAIINYHEMQNELIGVDSWLLQFAGSDSLCQKFKNYW